MNSFLYFIGHFYVVLSIKYRSTAIIRALGIILIASSKICIKEEKLILLLTCFGTHLFNGASLL